MNRILLLLLVALSFQACEKVKVGYLKTDEAEYVPNQLVIRKTPDPVLDAVRIANNSPWVTIRIQGILGTQPFFYEVAGVNASEGGNAEAFMKEISVRGAGIMELPLYHSVPEGKYTVTLKVRNEGHSAILEEIFTFVIQ